MLKLVQQLLHSCYDVFDSCLVFERIVRWRRDGYSDNGDVGDNNEGEGHGCYSVDDGGEESDNNGGGGGRREENDSAREWESGGDERRNDDCDDRGRRGGTR